MSSVDPTVGKHTALDEAVVDPLVAEALQRRQLPTAGTHRPGSPRAMAPIPPRTQRPPAGPVASAVGWPQEPGRGEGLGWPGDPGLEPVANAGQPGRPDVADDGSVTAALVVPDPGHHTPPSEGLRRSGWRRFFGGGHSSARSGTSAA